MQQCMKDSPFNQIQSHSLFRHDFVELFDRPLGLSRLDFFRCLGGGAERDMEPDEATKTTAVSHDIRPATTTEPVALISMNVIELFMS